MRVYFFLVLSILFLSSCGNDTNPPGKDISKADSPKKVDPSRIFALPAPLQVATWFYQHAGSPEIDLLADFSQDKIFPLEKNRSAS